MGGKEKMAIGTKSIWAELGTVKLRKFFINLEDLGITPEDVDQAVQDPDYLFEIGKKLCNSAPPSISIEEDSGEIKAQDLHLL